MKNLNEPVSAKGIFYNKKTKLCIFETNQGETKWYNVHINNIEGKFYQGCPAMLYQYDDDNEIIKAIILEPDNKKNNK